jgi:hypothetical protein
MGLGARFSVQKRVEGAACEGLDFDDGVGVGWRDKMEGGFGADGEIGVEIEIVAKRFFEVIAPLAEEIVVDGRDDAAEFSEPVAPEGAC